MKQELMEITEKNKYSTKDIAKWIRQTLKKDFPNCKFSVQTEYYSMGSSIHLTILQSDVRIIKKVSEITPEDILRLGNARNLSEEETIKMLQEVFAKETYFQVNQYYIDSDWQFTPEGKNFLTKVLLIANKYNWDKSDSMIDYFDVNYYLHFNLGRYDNPFIDGGDRK